MKKSAFSGFDHPQAEDTQPDYIAAPLRLLAIPIRDCHPDPANARTGHAIDRIAASLAQYGQRKPIVVNRAEGMKIEAGNGTWQAAVSLGWSHIAAVIVDDDPMTATGFGIADNRLSELSEWDMETLAALVNAIDPELPTGFGEGELEEMMAELGAGLPSDELAGRDAEPQIDHAQELCQQWGTASGQIWRLPSRTVGQEHRLVCGDCTDAGVVQNLMRGEVALLMVTDPPYGVNYDPEWRNEAAESGWLAYAPRRVGTVVGDDRVDWADAYRLFGGDIMYTWSPCGEHVIVTGLSIQSVGFEIRNQIVWVKPHFPISRGHYTYQHEPCWYAVRKGKTARWIGNTNASTRWDIALDKNVAGGHSTQKPLECMARPIRNHDAPLVYDPFVGSGTTIIACEGLGRQCRAVEISPAYVAVALQRYLDTVGIRPELLA